MAGNVLLGTELRNKAKGRTLEKSDAAEGIPFDIRREGFHLQLHGRSRQLLHSAVLGQELMCILFRRS
jgi:hypothetical protein